MSQGEWSVGCRDLSGRRRDVTVFVSQDKVVLVAPPGEAAVLGPLDVGRLRAALRDAVVATAIPSNQWHIGDGTSTLARAPPIGADVNWGVRNARNQHWGAVHERGRERRDRHGPDHDRVTHPGAGRDARLRVPAAGCRAATIAVREQTGSERAGSAWTW